MKKDSTVQKAKNEGLIRDIGVSNYSSDLIEKLIDTSGEIPTVNQIEWSPFGHSNEMLMYCKHEKIVIQAYSPLTRTRRLNDSQLNGIAVRYNKRPAQILIRWNIQLGGAVPIPKAIQKNI
jgi:2,5-diketo-D-gluconate reductase A